MDPDYADPSVEFPDGVPNPNYLDGFEAACRPLIKWLADNCHPHTTAIVTSVGAELVEGVRAFATDDYLRD